MSWESKLKFKIELVSTISSQAQYTASLPYLIDLFLIPIYNYQAISTYLITRQELNDMLEKAQMSKEEFSQKMSLKSTSVNNWGSSQNVPHWAESWLELYVENLQCKKLKKQSNRSMYTNN